MQSTCNIPEHKWKQIIHATSTYISDWGTGTAGTNVPSVSTNGHSRIIVSDDEAADEAVEKLGVNDDKD